MLFAARALGVNNSTTISIAAMLCYAKECNYTCPCELFSAQWVVDVMEAQWPGVLKARVVDLDGILPSDDEGRVNLECRWLRSSLVGELLTWCPTMRTMMIHSLSIMGEKQPTGWRPLALCSPPGELNRSDIETLC